MQERTTHETAALPPTAKAMLLASVLVLLLGIEFWWVHREQMKSTWLEDLPVYTQAVRNWLAGRDPYEALYAPMYFLYPPVFLFLAGLLSHLVPLHWGPAIYGSVSAAATCALPLVLARFFFRQPWLSPWFALLLFCAQPRFTGLEAAIVMNIASLLYFLAFAAAIPGLRRNLWLWFYIAVFLAAIVKITFLALLLLPLLTGRRQWARSFFCATMVVLTNVVQWWLWPALYSEYRSSLQQGILNAQAFGYGIFGILANYHYRQRGVGVAAYAVSGTLALLLVVMMFLLRRRLEQVPHLRQDPASNGVWLALVVVAIVLVNPRVMVYDMDIALIAGFVLLVYALRTKRLLPLMLVLPLPSLAVPLVVLNPHLHGMYETIFVWMAFGLAYWRFWRETQADKAESFPLVNRDAGFAGAQP